MAWRARVKLAVPAVAMADVRRGVRRSTGAAEEALIPWDGAGPDGFSVVAVQIEAGATFVRPPCDEHVVLHQQRGRTELEFRHTRLVPPGEGWSATAKEASTVLEVRYRAPHGGWRRRGGLEAGPDEITPVRDRFPVRFAPRLHDVLGPRTLFPVVGPVSFGPGRFAIRGPDELVMALATTPKGTGPALHVHRLSTEMFVVLAGRFRISWGERGEHEVELGPLDSIVVPTGVNRDFSALHDEENWLLALVVGCNDEMEDIVFLPAVEAELVRAGPAWLASIATSTRIRVGERVGEVR